VQRRANSAHGRSQTAAAGDRPTIGPADLEATWQSLQTQSVLAQLDALGVPSDAQAALAQNSAVRQAGGPDGLTVTREKGKMHVEGSQRLVTAMARALAQARQPRAACALLKAGAPGAAASALEAAFAELLACGQPLAACKLLKACAEASLIEAVLLICEAHKPALDGIDQAGGKAAAALNLAIAHAGDELQRHQDQDGYVRLLRACSPATQSAVQNRRNRDAAAQAQAMVNAQQLATIVQAMGVQPAAPHTAGPVGGVIEGELPDRGMHVAAAALLGAPLPQNQQRAAELARRLALVRDCSANGLFMQEGQIDTGWLDSLWLLCRQLTPREMAEMFSAITAGHHLVSGILANLLSELHSIATAADPRDSLKALASPELLAALAGLQGNRLLITVAGPVLAALADGSHAAAALADWARRVGGDPARCKGAALLLAELWKRDDATPKILLHRVATTVRLLASQQTHPTLVKQAAQRSRVLAHGLAAMDASSRAAFILDLKRVAASLAPSETDNLTLLLQHLALLLQAENSAASLELADQVLAIVNGLPANSARASRKPNDPS
jgi:hypothetical protein